MNDRDLMQEALDALESLQAWPETPENFKRFRAIEALRARLAQPEPEPVAWISHNAGLYHGKPDESLNPLPLYTVPPQRKEWVGLTREELEEISEFHFHGALSGREFYDDVEAKLKEKNI